MTTPITRRYRFWITVGAVCLALALVLLCNGFHGSGAVASTAAGASWIAALAMWDGPRARRQHEQFLQERRDLHERLRVNQRHDRHN